MGKKNKNNQKKINTQKETKNKQIKPVANNRNKSQEPKPKVSNLFTIVNQNQQQPIQFNALGNDESSEQKQVIINKKKNGTNNKKNKQKKQIIQQPEQQEQQQVQYQPQNNEEIDQDDDVELDQQNQQQIDDQYDEQQQYDDQIQEQAKNQINNEEQNGQQIDQQNQDDVDCDAPPLENQPNQKVDVSVMALQIQQTIGILLNIQKLGQGKSRKHFIQKLKTLVHQYYGYNYQLIDHFLNFLNPTQMVQLFEANQTQRPLTIRTNTLKTRRKELAQSLIQRGVNLDPLAQWSKVGIKVYQSKVPVGATPQYLAGHYMLQSASSLLPVLALDPQPGQRILDLASAPGGKTTYIAQQMKNTGCLFANDLKKERLKALQYNLYRLGVTNTIVTCRDGRKYPLIFPGSFDRVLLDAPCTGLGIIAKDHSIKANRLLIDIQKNSHVQKQLLLAAIDCTRVGGVIVYSTCSVSPLQNQQVVNFALKKRHVKIEDIQIQVGQPGILKFVEKRYHPDLVKTRRIYPHVHNMDGFYVARLVKTAKGKKDIEKANNDDDK